MKKKKPKSPKKKSSKKESPDTSVYEDEFNKLAEQEIAYESIVGAGNIIGTVVILKAILPNAVNAGATGIP